MGYQYILWLSLIIFIFILQGTISLKLLGSKLAPKMGILCTEKGAPKSLVICTPDPYTSSQLCLSKTEDLADYCVKYEDEHIEQLSNSTIMLKVRH